MPGISISLFELLTKGIPEGFLFVFAIYTYTGMEIEAKRYLLLGTVVTVITYLTRWLPINLESHTMLSLLILIILFIVFNKINLLRLVKTVTSVIVIAIIITVSEALNLLLLMSFFGKKGADNLLNSGSSVIKSLSEMPSTLLFAVIVLLSYLSLRKIAQKKRARNGEASKEVSE